MKATEFNQLEDLSADDGRSEELPCQECGARNPVWWSVSGAWNLAVGGDPSREAGGMLCPTCFHRRWLIATGTREDAEVRAGVVAEEPPSMKVLDERDTECVKAWPDCASGAYDPACCRFPKSCSAGVVRMVPVKQEGADQ